MVYEVNLEIAALIVVAIVYVYAKINYPSKNKKNNLFRFMAIMVMIAESLDIFTAFVISYKEYFPRIVNLLGNTGYFMAGLSLCYIFGLYIDEHIIPKEGIRIYPMGKKILLVLMEVTIFLNIFFGYFFAIAEDNTYVHGPLFYVIHGVSLVFIFLACVTLVLNFKRLTKVQLISGVVINLLYIIPVILQVFLLPDTLLIMFGASLIMLVTFFSLETTDYVKLQVTTEELQKTTEELKATMEDLDVAREEAVNAKNAQAQFLARMSHEIRTPINAVLGLDTMILRESKEKGIRKYARDIQGAGESLLSLINDILDFSKIESGKMQLIYGEYDMAVVVNDVANMIRPKAMDKGLHFLVCVDENMPSSYIGDDIRLKQIMVNLLTNAVKYTHTGSVKLVIDCEKEDYSALIHVSVQDTGIGIKEEDLGKLNEEFVRIEENRNKNIEGTGLGINIVTSLLQLMNSKLEVESVYGEGSNFHFTIRQTIRDEEPIGDFEERLTSYEEEEEYVASFSIPDCKLLVVDDNAMNRKVFVHLLKDLQCEIVEAESGRECLELIQKEKYDLIFMDHMMPEMDGIETFHKLKEMKGHPNVDTPVIILTANAINGARKEYLSMGFDEYLTKPIDAERLEKMIGAMIPPRKKKEIRKKVEDPEERIAEQPESRKTELPFVDGVDWQSALNKLTSEEILLDSVEAFLVMAKPELKTLTEMYERVLQDQSEENYSSYRIKVHSMKSSAATIGAYHVAGLAKYLEYAARDQDLDTIQRIMPLLQREWMALKDNIDEAFGNKRDSNVENRLSEVEDRDADEAGESAEVAKGLDREELMGYLSILLEAVEEVDLDRADAVMEELEEHSYPEEQQEIIEELRVQVMTMDEEACNSLVEKMKNLL